MQAYFLLSFAIAIGSYAFGQEDALVVKEATKINRQVIPAPVIDSLNKFFPQAVPIEF